MSLPKKRTQFGPIARHRPKPPRKVTPAEMARRTQAYIDFMKPDGKK